MTKAALNMFTKAAAIELAPHGIRVNSLAPGAIETDINREVIDRIGRDKFAQGAPLACLDPFPGCLGRFAHVQIPFPTRRAPD